MKEQLRLLFFKDIGGFLKKEQVKYLAISDDNFYYVKELPLVYNEYISALKEYFAYDYDEINPIYQEIFDDKILNLTQVDDNKYIKTKVFKKK